jgi:hypothetical protein
MTSIALPSIMSRRGRAGMLALLAHCLIGGYHAILNALRRSNVATYFGYTGSFEM